MSTEEHAQQAVPDGIQDTGDLERIWDALERLAGRVDGGGSAPTGDEEAPPPRP